MRHVAENKLPANEVRSETSKGIFVMDEGGCEPCAVIAKRRFQ